MLYYSGREQPEKNAQILRNERALSGKYAMDAPDNIYCNSWRKIQRRKTDVALFVVGPVCSRGRTTVTRSTIPNSLQRTLVLIRKSGSKVTAPRDKSRKAESSKRAAVSESERVRWGFI